jgi:hypothetical protein
MQEFKALYNITKEKDIQVSYFKYPQLSHIIKELYNDATSSALQPFPM